MMKILQKLLIFSVLVCISFYESSAQANIGLGLNISSGAVKTIDGNDYKGGLYGINLRSSFKLNKKWELTPAINYAFPRTETGNQGSADVQFMYLDINGHYLFSPKKKFCPYGLIGAGLQGWNIKDDRVIRLNMFQTETRDVDEFKISYAVNLGLGFKLDIKYNLTIFSELKYGIGPEGQFILAAGVFYNFK